MATAVEGEVVVEQSVKTEALALIEQARSIKVTSAEEYASACDFGKECAARYKKAEIYFDGLVEPAYRAYKTLVAARDAILKPLEAAKKHVSQLAANWQIEERKRAEAEAEKLRLQAIREEEDRRLAQAEALQAEGRKEEAEQVLCEETIPVPVVANVSENVPRVAGTSSARVRYYARVTSLKLLIKAIAEGKVPEDMVVANESALNKVADATKGKMNFPGVETYHKAGVSFRS